MIKSDFLALCFLILGILLLVEPCLGQQRAFTERGDSIYVYSDGTWSYELRDEKLNLSPIPDIEIVLDTVSESQTFPSFANSSLSSSFGMFELKYDSKKFKRVPPGNYNEDAEFALVGRELDLYCIIISEETQVGIENIVKIALGGLRENSGGSVVVKKTEVRNVNGVNVIRGLFDVDMSGMNITFDSYYYSSEKGTIQVTTWSGTNVWEKYQSDILDLLNGLVISK